MHVVSISGHPIVHVWRIEEPCINTMGSSVWIWLCRQLIACMREPWRPCMVTLMKVQMRVWTAHFPWYTHHYGVKINHENECTIKWCTVISFLDDSAQIITGCGLTTTTSFGEMFVHIEKVFQLHFQVSKKLCALIMHDHEKWGVVTNKCHKNWKLPLLQCYHTFSNYRGIYLLKNHH